MGVSHARAPPRVKPKKRGPVTFQTGDVADDETGFHGEARSREKQNKFARLIKDNSARGFLIDDWTRGPPFARARRAPNFVKDARAIA